MKICSECNGKMIEKLAHTPEGVGYRYYRCNACGEEIVNMKQLHNVAEKYRVMKRYSAKLSKWGVSMGLRIPKALVNRYKLKNSDEVTIIPEGNCIKIITSKM